MKRIYSCSSALWSPRSRPLRARSWRTIAVRAESHHSASYPQLSK
jgi:hypothetical protein